MCNLQGKIGYVGEQVTSVACFFMVKLNWNRNVLFPKERHFFRLILSNITYILKEGFMAL